MNETSAIRRYMRDHQGKVVHIATSDKNVEGSVFLVGTRGIWLIDSHDQDEFVQYDTIHGYSDKVVR